jgi:hypothetical protein
VVTSDKAVEIDLTTHLHFVDRLRIRGDVSQLPYTPTGLEQGRY